MLLEENGNLVAFGSNEFGQLGIPATYGQDQRAPEVVIFQTSNQNDEGSVTNQGIQMIVNEVVCFQDSTACITDENEIYRWGKDIEKDDLLHEEPHLVSRLVSTENINNPFVTKMFILPTVGYIMVAKESNIRISKFEI